MNKRIIRYSLLVLLLSLLTVSCNDKLGDDLRSLGSRVEVLENRVLRANEDIESLWIIVKAIQTNGYVSKIEDKGNNTYELIITYTDVADGQTKTKPVILHNGNPGKGTNPIVNVKQGDDGQMYWTFDGTNWLPIGGYSAEIPQLRISTNSEGKEIWESYSYEIKDWVYLGLVNGDVGDDDIYEYVRLSSDQTKLHIKVKGSPIEIVIAVNLIDFNKE